MSKIILETQRLILREFNQSDFYALSKILQDVDVMYAYEHDFDDNDVQEWLDNQFKRYEKDGFGLWAVELKNNNKVIGQCGITLQDVKGKQVLEVGYLFQKEFWHRGYATEAAVACKEYAFNVLKATEIFSIIKWNNIPSQKVADRNGMIETERFVKNYKGKDMLHILYLVKK